jgi:hypothetical protein
MTPTTQVTQHHLAAHEAAVLSAEEHSSSVHHLRRQLAGVIAEDDNSHDGGYGMDEDYKTHDGDRTRTGTLEEGSPQPGAPQGPNKRKRVFSNRTKTGCITCRRRKKKCDEGKPECLSTLFRFPVLSSFLCPALLEIQSFAYFYDIRPFFFFPVFENYSLTSTRLTYSRQQLQARRFRLRRILGKDQLAEATR